MNPKYHRGFVDGHKAAFDWIESALRETPGIGPKTVEKVIQAMRDKAKEIEQKR